ncbi:MAG: hypothetical protein PSV22_08180, partial [Pseudolabrys sp.]|nr:hypothetical protein [Pseudolabrys sp.]
MRASQSRILTTHVGSLPRTNIVVGLLENSEHEPHADIPQFAETMRTAVADIVRQQVETGIDIVSDGEQTRQHFVTTFIEHLSGVDFDKRETVRIRDR